MAPQRVIKKYPNRRLYDTRISSYITLEEVRQLVLAGEPFEVRDARTDEDLTRPVLLQIIPFYGDAMQGFVGGYLENSLKIFLDQQHKFRAQLNNLLGQTPWSMLNEITERNLELWKSMQADTVKPPPADSGEGDKTARKRR